MRNLHIHLSTYHQHVIKHRMHTKLYIFNSMKEYLVTVEEDSIAAGLLGTFAGGWIIKLVANGSGFCTAVFTGGATAQICC